MAFEPGMDRKVMLPPVKFRIDVRQEADGVRICPAGEIDVATIGRLRERLDEAMVPGVSRLILDLRDVTFIDSTALHLALDADARAARNGTAFSIIAGPPAVQRTFEVAGMSERLPFVEMPRPRS
jgi:anti-anti-sigma factor